MTYTKEGTACYRLHACQRNKTQLVLPSAAAGILSMDSAAHKLACRRLDAALRVLNYTQWHLEVSLLMQVGLAVMDLCAARLQLLQLVETSRTYTNALCAVVPVAFARHRNSVMLHLNILARGIKA